MKRSPLKRRSPIKRGFSQLKRTPLKKVSRQREKQNREYSKLRKAFLEEHPTCRVCEESGYVAQAATEIHHADGRENELLNKTESWIPICRDHHYWVHDNPAKARLKGWLK